jgi:MinD-like ATPase involved in chromosome partitioning or flagellar assembly
VIVTVASVRGAPGATSWSLLLAAAWPAEDPRQRAVLEVDLDGGVLGARYGLGVDPGVVSLIASLRRNDDVVSVDEHGRVVGERVWLVPGPESAERARAVWTGAAAAVAARLADDDRVWLVDAGRLHTGSATVPFAERSSLTLLLSRSSPEDVVQVPARVEALQAHARSVGVVVIGKTPYGVAELSEFVGTRLVWKVAKADDLPAVAGGALRPGRARRSLVWRSALDLAATVARQVDVATTTAVGVVAGRPGVAAEADR